MQEEIKPQPKQETEVDLGVFFNLLSKIFNKIINLIGGFIDYTGGLLLIILLFIKRNIVWLLIGTLIGFSFGYYKYQSQGPNFYSDMVLRTNFDGGSMLYNKLEYFNSLIKLGRTKDLAKTFSITEIQANKLKEFTVSPIRNDFEAAKLYRTTFLDNIRNNDTGDTLWSKTMSFNEFKKTLSDIDFPLQKVRLYSSDPDVYSNVERGLINSVVNNKSLQSIKDSTSEMLNDEEYILQRSLNGLDSLRDGYNKRIRNLALGSKGEGNNVVIADKEIKSPEVELFDKELILKDELIKAKKRKIEQQDILQVYAGFNATGMKVSSFNQDFTKYSWIGLLISFIVVLLVNLFIYLGKIEKKRKLIA